MYKNNIFIAIDKIHYRLCGMAKIAEKQNTNETSLVGLRIRSLDSFIITFLKWKITQELGKFKRVIRKENNLQLRYHITKNLAFNYAVLFCV